MPVPTIAPMFVPAHIARLRDKALALDIGTALLDLEDAVPPDEKHAARIGAAAFLGGRPGRDFVRINPFSLNRGFGVPCGEEDLAAVLVQAPRGIVAPKIETMAGLQAIERRITELERASGRETGSTEMWVTIETALGVSNLTEIARTPVCRPMRLLFGMGDYTTDLGIEWSRDETECDVPRASIPIAARAADLPRPLDSVFVATDDDEGLRASALRGKRLGYGGKIAIHPRQIPVILDVFRPTRGERSWAQRVVEAAAEHGGKGIGAFLLDGRMIDEPIVMNAGDILARAEQFGDET